MCHTRSQAECAGWPFRGEAGGHPVTDLRGMLVTALIGWTAAALTAAAALALAHAVRGWGFGDCCPHDEAGQ
jgi:hypothetical protein